MIQKLKKKLHHLRNTRKFTSFYKNYIQEGDLCFDIGAHVGERTEIFLDLNVKVVAVEPVKESYDVLQQNFGSNINAIILPFALGSTSEQREIYISDVLEVCTLSKSFIKEYANQDKFNIRWEEIRRTDVKTLDQLIGEYGLPAFCKIDVEGYEEEVLKGLSQPIPFISFEYNFRLKDVALNCIQLLTKLNGSVLFNFSAYESMKFSSSSWKNGADFYPYIQTLNEEIETGDIYVKST